jgi:hypothetical protein
MLVVGFDMPLWMTLFPVVGFGFFEAMVLFSIMAQAGTSAYALANKPKPPAMPEGPEPPKPDLVQEANLKAQAEKRARARAGQPKQAPYGMFGASEEGGVSKSALLGG